MEKSWMKENRLSKEYELGVETFLNFGLQNANGSNLLRCPCLKCGNRMSKDVSTIRTHLYVNGIDQSYKIWFWHGEVLGTDDIRYTFKDDIHENIEEDNDLFNVIDMVQAAHDQSSEGPEIFDSTFEDAKKPLYTGCNKFTKLSALVRLYNLKVRFGWSNTSFSELLIVLRELLPEDNVLPVSMYEAKKTLCGLGLNYQKIDACPNDCCLYRKEFAKCTKCPHCNASRWKLRKNSKEEKTGIAAKQMWYFPIIPRFLRMFKSTKHAKDLVWHATDRIIDGTMRHPADSPAWRLIDHLWPDFGLEPRNLRLGLSTDGINPYGDMSTKYSCWPVITTIYNLPPWLCMRRKFLMLSMLISGPKQPGYDINVYLAPLIEDLRVLWEDGVQCYDAHKREFFTLKVVLLWTINDFPAYGNLSGCKVKGYKGCPICGENTNSIRLQHGGKNAYLSHRKYLPRFHPYRKQKKAFDGSQEYGNAPVPLSGEEVLIKLKTIKFVNGKKGDKKSNILDSSSYWKSMPAFFELPYWKKLHVRHCLDVMHIEKNVCMNIVGTLLNIPGKTKDGINAREDLEAMGIRPELAPIRTGNRTYIPPACYTLSKAEKHSICKSLCSIKVPEGYSSNIRSIVSLDDLKVSGMKSHDCHILMQQLLPIALRAVLPKNVRFAITRFCFFFNSLCSKNIKVAELDKLQDDIVVTLCLFEKYFPPSFFTIMVHLTIHLVREVKLCGPVYLRWMYPFERYMKVLKGYVHNKSRPEGSIAEAYIVEEAVEFCTEFLNELDPIGLGSISLRNNTLVDRPLSAGSFIKPSVELLKQAHLYILENSVEVQPYRDKHLEFLKAQNPRKCKNEKWLKEEHNRSFANWLRDKVALEIHGGLSVSNNVRWIAHGPFPEVLIYDGYMINGCTYSTKTRDNSRNFQNSGISLVASTMQVSSAKDKNPIVSNMCFYGVIQEIWELSYNAFKFILFRCDWVATHNGVCRDEFGFTLVNFNRIGHRSDPFILANQARQVFYVEDPLDAQWSIVVTPPEREYSNTCFNDELSDTCLYYPPTSERMPQPDLDENEASYARPDCEGTWVNN